MLLCWFVVAWWIVAARVCFVVSLGVGFVRGLTGMGVLGWLVLLVLPAPGASWVLCWFVGLYNIICCGWWC